MPRPIPLWLKIGYLTFLAILIPVYLHFYGPTNFLYFCDLALLLTLAGLWLNSPLLISMPAVGILLPQAAWLVDFAGNILHVRLLGMTDYMFDARKPWYLRGLSLFHGWLPILLVYLLTRTGYDRRAFLWWTVLAWVVMPICYFVLPPPGSHPEDPNHPVNVNYVFGLSDEHAQTALSPILYFAVMMLGMPLLFFLPTHAILAWLMPRAVGQLPATNSKSQS
jgi:hypothetical protein